MNENLNLCEMEGYGSINDAVIKFLKDMEE